MIRERNEFVRIRDDDGMNMPVDGRVGIHEL